MARKQAQQDKPASSRLVRLPTVRCTEAELAGIRQRAATAGMTQSAYLRQIAVTGRVVVRQVRADAALYDQLRRVGVNLNQIAHAVHVASGVIPPDLSVSLARLDAALEAVLAE